MISDINIEKQKRRINQVSLFVGSIFAFGKIVVGLTVPGQQITMARVAVCILGGIAAGLVWGAGTWVVCTVTARVVNKIVSRLTASGLNVQIPPQLAKTAKRINKLSILISLLPLMFALLFDFRLALAFMVANFVPLILMTPMLANPVLDGKFLIRSLASLLGGAVVSIGVFEYSIWGMFGTLGQNLLAASIGASCVFYANSLVAFFFARKCRKAVAASIQRDDAIAHH